MESEYNSHHKITIMPNSNIIDISAVAGLFLFTGADIGIEGSILELISKFGVVAVLWFWLRDMKSQMQHQLKSFTEETKLVREDHKTTLKEFTAIHEEHRQILSEQLKAKDDLIKQLKIKG